MRKLFITQRLIEDQDTKEIRECLDIRWAAFLDQCGLTPWPLSYSIPPAAYFSDQPAGVILSGGNDLSILNSNPLNKLRDEYENTLLRICIESKIPVLGVCRGMQLISNLCGEIPRPVQDHVKMPHKLTFSVGTQYFSHYPNQIEVNSFHNYGLLHSPENLKAAARSEDQSIEAFEHNDLPIVGIMWHPERQAPASPHDKTLIETLFCRKK